MFQLSQFIRSSTARELWFSWIASRANIKYCFKLWKELQKHTSCLKLFIELKLDLVRVVFEWSKSFRRDVRTSRWPSGVGGRQQNNCSSSCVNWWAYSWWRVSCRLSWRQSCHSDASHISSFYRYSESQRDDQATALSPDLAPGGLSVFLKWRASSRDKTPGRRGQQEKRNRRIKLNFLGRHPCGFCNF
jgi:hypothetical protein